MVHDSCCLESTAVVPREADACVRSYVFPRCMNIHAPLFFFFFPVGRWQGLRYRNDGGRTAVPRTGADSAASGSSPLASGVEGAGERPGGGAGGALGGGEAFGGQTGATKRENDYFKGGGCSRWVEAWETEGKMRHYGMNYIESR